MCGIARALACAMDHDILVSEKVIGCAIEVHKALGPGLLERPYHLGLCVELAHQGIHFDRDRLIPLVYRDVEIGEYHPDLIVEDTVVVEVKSALRWEDVFTAQMLTCLRLTERRVGLIINFNKPLLREGVKRVVL